MNAPDLFLFDLDGTVADCGHRRHLVSGPGPRRFDLFDAACDQDQPNRPVVLVLNALIARGAECRIVSGRSASARIKTEFWLMDYTDFYLQPGHWDRPRLYMRPVGDYRPDEELKQAYLDAMAPEDRVRLTAVYDDRDKVVAMWRRNGVPCFQVAPGDF